MVKKNHYNLKLLLLMIIFLKSRNVSASWQGSKYQIECTMCSACDNPCATPPPPSRSPPPPSPICPPPPSPPSSGNYYNSPPPPPSPPSFGNYYNSPPPPTPTSYSYNPPPSSSTGGGYFKPPPPPPPPQQQQFPTGPAPPPPNPIVPYFPYYYYSPPSKSSSSSLPPLQTFSPITCKSDNKVSDSQIHTFNVQESAPDSQILKLVEDEREGKKWIFRSALGYWLDDDQETEDCGGLFWKSTLEVEAVKYSVNY